MPTSTGKLTSTEMNQLTALIRAQAAVREQLSTTSVTAVQRAFDAVADFYDPKQTKQAVETALKTVQAQQRRMAQVTDAYMARSTQIITGRRYTPVGAVDVTKLRRQLPQEIVETLARAETTPQGAGPALTAAEQAAVNRAKSAVGSVEPAQPYGRIADAYRYRVTSGLMDEAAARRYVQHRAATVADTDIMLADRAQSTKFLSERNPNNTRGYRRVLHPELGSGAPPCGLCVVAADRIYSVRELMPLHAMCRCGIAVVGSNDDPGFRLNEQDLARIYRQAKGSTDAAKLKQIQVEIVEHGEFGPWLVNPQQRFRGPREVAKTQSTDAGLNALAQLETVTEDLERLLTRQSDGEDVDEAVRWHRRKAKQLDALIPR